MSENSMDAAQQLPALEHDVKPVGWKAAGKEILGKFGTARFWINVAQTVLEGAVSAFFIGLGSALANRGRTTSKEIEGMFGPPRPVPPAPSPVDRAFGGYQPAPTYQPPASYPVPTQQPSEQRFPGFGR